MRPWRGNQLTVREKPITGPAIKKVGSRWPAEPGIHRRLRSVAFSKQPPLRPLHSMEDFA